MKIKFRKAFRTKTGEIPANKEVDIDASLAKSYINDGYAVAVEKASKSKKRTASK